MKKLMKRIISYIFLSPKSIKSSITLDFNMQIKLLKNMVSSSQFLI